MDSIQKCLINYKHTVDYINRANRIKKLGIEKLRKENSDLRNCLKDANTKLFVPRLKNTRECSSKLSIQNNEECVCVVSEQSSQTSSCSSSTTILEEISIHSYSSQMQCEAKCCCSKRNRDEEIEREDNSSETTELLTSINELCEERIRLKEENSELVKFYEKQMKEIKRCLDKEKSESKNKDLTISLMKDFLEQLCKKCKRIEKDNILLSDDLEKCKDEIKDQERQVNALAERNETIERELSEKTRRIDDECENCRRLEELTVERNEKCCALEVELTDVRHDVWEKNLVIEELRADRRELNCKLVELVDENAAVNDRFVDLDAERKRARQLLDQMDAKIEDLTEITETLRREKQAAERQLDDQTREYESSLRKCFADGIIEGKRQHEEAYEKYIAEQDAIAELSAQSEVVVDREESPSLSAEEEERFSVGSPEVETRDVGSQTCCLITRSVSTLTLPSSGIEPCPDSNDDNDKDAVSEVAASYHPSAHGDAETPWSTQSSSSTVLDEAIRSESVVQATADKSTSLAAVSELRRCWSLTSSSDGVFDTTDSCCSGWSGNESDCISGYLKQAELKSELDEMKCREKSYQSTICELQECTRVLKEQLDNTISMVSHESEISNKGDHAKLTEEKYCEYEYKSKFENEKLDKSCMVDLKPTLKQKNTIKEIQLNESESNRTKQNENNDKVIKSKTKRRKLKTKQKVNNKPKTSIFIPIGEIPETLEELKKLTGPRWNLPCNCKNKNCMARPNVVKGEEDLKKFYIQQIFFNKKKGNKSSKFC